MSVYLKSNGLFCSVYFRFNDLSISDLIVCFSLFTSGLMVSVLMSNGLSISGLMVSFGQSI